MPNQCRNDTQTSMTYANSEKNPTDVLLFIFTALGFGICFSITVSGMWEKKLIVILTLQSSYMEYVITHCYKILSVKITPVSLRE